MGLLPSSRGGLLIVQTSVIVRFSSRWAVGVSGSPSPRWTSSGLLCSGMQRRLLVHSSLTRGADPPAGTTSKGQEISIQRHFALAFVVAYDSANRVRRLLFSIQNVQQPKLVAARRAAVADGQQRQLGRRASNTLIRS